MEESAFVKPRGSAVELVISGRKFLSVSETSFEQDIFIMQHLQESGLQELSEKFDITKDDIGDVAQKVIVTAFASGKLFDLVAATLQEVGKPWTIESAKANSRFFASLTNKKDKDNLKSSIVAVILSFFASGLLSSMNSPSSLMADRGIKLESTAPSSESGLPDGDSIPSGTGTL